MVTTFGKYEVICPLSLPGSGQASLVGLKGFAGFRKLVVLRDVLPALEGQEAAQGAFVEEVKMVASFHHPHIAEVYDLEAADARLGLLTEFIPGGTLEEVAAAYRASKMRVPLGFFLMALRDVALGLHYAHTFQTPLGEPHPLAHGGISGATIQVSFEGITKIMDFGAPRPQSAGATPAGDVKALGPLFPAVLAETAVDTALASRPDLTPEIRSLFTRLTGEGFPSAMELAKAIEVAAGPVIWRQDQAANLTQRMFTQRRDELRQVLGQAQDSGTAVMPLAQVFAEAKRPKAAPKEDPQTLPPSRVRSPIGDELFDDVITGRHAKVESEEAEPRTAVGLPNHFKPEQDTGVRRVPERRPSGRGRPPARRPSGSLTPLLLALGVLMAVGLVVFKWRIDPAFFRTRAPKLAKALEKLAVIPGFPPPEVARAAAAPDAGDKHSL